MASDYVILYTQCIAERRGISQIYGFRSGQGRLWYRMKKILKRTGKVFCLFLLTLMALHVAAQDKVKLSGRVIDDEQNPVLFAVVKVDGQAAGTTTDLQGRYQLEFSTADTVTVSFSMIGYVTKKKTLVRPKGSLRLNITLQTQSIDMGEVTVKEVRRQMNSTQHLNAENLKRLPCTT